ncbi:MAG: hypothetical protein RLZZ410_1047 [Pseudomonadota bacterium]|jgi:hypothetical protein
MSNSSSVPRQLIHTRKISADIFLREDGLWDIEASLLDTKSKDFPLSSGVRSKGQPIHNMTLCVTIDKEFNVLHAKVKAKNVPYLGHCEKIEPDYEKLVGLNLVRGFRSAIKDLFSGVSGCSHITELCSVLPTAAIQGFAGEVIMVKEHGDGQMPFQLNGCHALRTDGEAVKKYHPTWFGAPIKSKEN